MKFTPAETAYLSALLDSERRHHERAAREEAARARGCYDPDESAEHQDRADMATWRAKTLSKMLKEIQP